VLAEVPQKNVTRTLSLRIPEQILSDIEKEAKTNLVSTNVLINQVLHNYINWDRHSKRMKMYPISESILRIMLQKSKELEDGKLADLIFDSIRECTLITKKRFDFDSCLQVLGNYCNMFGITFDNVTSSGKSIFTIRHNLGKNFSLLFEKLFEKILWDLGKARMVDCQSTRTCIVVTTKNITD
jgi:hypothetical protein